MLTYDFSDQGADSLYAYLYRKIRADILSGHLKSGEKLPSKRALAAHLGISVITVENTYAQLAAEGYIRPKARSGFYVEDIGAVLLAPDLQNDRQNADSEPDAYRSAAPPSAAADTINPAPPIDLVDAHADPAQFPFSVWSRLMREILRTKQTELLQRAPGTGVFALREAIARHLLQYQSLSVSPEQILIGAGTEYLYGLLIRLLGPEKAYAVETPGYPKTARIYESNRVRVCGIPMDEGGLSAELLRESDTDIVHVSPSHQFPTGITMPVARRSALLSWCAEREGRFIIEDDYDSEFRLAGRPIPSLMSMDRSGCVVYLNTFTKSVASTIRISYMVLPEALMERYRKTLGFYSCTVSSFEQYILAEFIRRGEFERHINRMRNRYRQKRDRLLAALRASALSGRSEVLGADAGLHFLLRVHSPLPEAELTARAAAVGVRVLGLHHYAYQTKTESSYPGSFPDAAPCMVISYQGLSDAQIDALPDLLAETWLDTDT